MSSETSISLNGENSVDKLMWPSRREDCEWMTDNFATFDSQGIKYTEVDSLLFRDEIISYGIHAPFNSPEKLHCKRRCSKVSPKRRSSGKLVSGFSGAARKPRQPLRDITGKNINGASSASQSNHSLPESWHRAFTNLLATAAKERDDPNTAP